MKRLDLGTVLLNWNGAADTLACLSSIYAQGAVPAYMIVVDNGSTDGSIDAVLSWLRAQQGFVASELGVKSSDAPRVREFALRFPTSANGEERNAAEEFRIVLIENGANLGFAAGNNVGVRWLMQRDPRYVLLLNNDTVLGDDALALLVDGLEQSPERQCLVPQIRYFGAPDRIWNCGGEWTWIGMPRYHYAEANVSELAGKAPFEVTFVTGCAVIFRSTWLATHGLLTERFFFGEEDVELSWRMRRSGAGSMGCWPTSIIYHKVGVSIARMSEVSALPKIYCYHLSRLIFLRMIWGRGFRWQARRLASAAFLGWRLVSRFGAAPGVAFAFVRDLARDSSEKEGVSAEFFLWLMKEKFQHGVR